MTPEEKIADLKANFDYVLEGKEVEYREERKKLCDDFENMKAGLESQIATLGERCNQLLKDKGDLTDKLADIKANCDLAIQGRDIKIKELELELTVEKDQHQEEINLHLHAEDYIKSLEKENAELKARLNAINLLTPELEKRSKLKNQQLTKAKDLILKLYNAGRDVLMCRAEEKAYDNLSNAINDKGIEQFLKQE